MTFLKVPSCSLWGWRVQAASCLSVLWQAQILLNTPSIHLSLFLHDTEWEWQSPGHPSLDLGAQFSAVRIIGLPPCSLVHLWSPQTLSPPSPCQLWTHVQQYHLPFGAYVPTSFPPGDPVWPSYQHPAHACWNARERFDFCPDIT